MRIWNQNRTIIVTLDENTDRYSVTVEGENWNWSEDYSPSIETAEGKVLFHEAFTVTRQEISMGIGMGIRSFYQGKEELPLWKDTSFQTMVWLEETTGNVYFEWIPVEDGKAEIKKVLWPGPMEFSQKREDWYTLVNDRQGLLIPNDWDCQVDKLVFDGMFLTAGGFMPWFSQIREGSGYIAIAITPWNGGVNIHHPKGGPYTEVAVRWEPSLGSMDYRRVLRYTFLQNCDYNDMCKVYRNYVKETGLFCTLKEKEARVPSVRDLIGSAFVHTGIKTSVNPKSDFYDEKAPDKNNHLTAFKTRLYQMEQLKEMGVEKLYLHLDGWGEPGYDNKHPDYTPACEEAGGWGGMKDLADSVQKMGYMFGIHDQYRDYYEEADSFDPEFACRLTDGTIPRHSRWAGGPQSYLCATQAPHYVKRNFNEIKKNGIRLDGAYLDVFTCNEGDECTNPLHRMSRRECYEFRGRCFNYLLSQGILTSSEESADWSMESLVFCHYSPYSFMLEEPGKPREGVAVPLFNLVYHDCLIEPWMMEHFEGQEDFMLYALLNGGAPYLIRDGAYAGTDGSFEGGKDIGLEEQIERCKIVSQLHEKVAMCEMVSHEFVKGDWEVQRSVFSDGTKVTVNLRENLFDIS